MGVNILHKNTLISKIKLIKYLNYRPKMYHMHGVNILH